MFIVESIGEAVDAVGRLDQVSRDECRQVFETRFSARAMARNYLDLYTQLLSSGEALLTAV